MELRYFFILFGITIKSSNIDAMDGGEFHSITDVPYLVYIRFETNTLYYSCSGSIISEYWILSAAHCFANHYDSVIVHVGSHLINSGIEYGVEKKIVYGDYEEHNVGPIGIYGDLSLLKVMNEIQFSRFVQPIALSNLYPKVGEIVHCAGYGVALHDINPGQLQISDTSVIDAKTCRELWEDDSFIVENLTFCLDSTYVVMGSGDSGGPAVLNGKIVGVLSSGGEDHNDPDVYTSVAGYYDWIIKHTGIEYEE